MSSEKHESTKTQANMGFRRFNLGGRDVMWSIHVHTELDGKLRSPRTRAHPGLRLAHQLNGKHCAENRREDSDLSSTRR